MLGVGRRGVRGVWFWMGRVWGGCGMSLGWGGGIVQYLLFRSVFFWVGGMCSCSAVVLVGGECFLSYWCCVGVFVLGVIFSLFCLSALC